MNCNKIMPHRRERRLNSAKGNFAIRNSMISFEAIEHKLPLVATCGMAYPH